MRLWKNVQLSNNQSENRLWYVSRIPSNYVFTPGVSTELFLFAFALDTRKCYERIIVGANDFAILVETEEGWQRRVVEWKEA